MSIRGVRGATTVPCNDERAILDATGELLREMVARNGINPEEIASALFTMTADLDAAFPARAARSMGWAYVPLMDAQEIPVPGSLPRCIRVLILWNTGVPQRDVIHVYQGEARILRPDLGAAAIRDARPGPVSAHEEGKP